MLRAEVDKYENELTDLTRREKDLATERSALNQSQQSFQKEEAEYVASFNAINDSHY